MEKIEIPLHDYDSFVERLLSDFEHLIPIPLLNGYFKKSVSVFAELDFEKVIFKVTDLFSSLQNFNKEINLYLKRQSMYSTNALFDSLVIYKETLQLKIDPISKMWDYYYTADGTTKQIIDIFFLRILYPLEGLKTVNSEGLVSIAEMHFIKSNIKEYIIDEFEPEPRWDNGKDIKYNNFICIILKLTRLCNLRCKYCLDWREGQGHTMSFENAIVIFRNIIQTPGIKNIEFVWHGGEPTLLGIKKMARLLLVMALCKAGPQKIVNTIQTNGVILNTNLIHFLRVFQFKLAVSIDGPQQLHDRNRPDTKGRPTFDRIKKNFRLLLNSGFPLNIIMVANENLFSLGTKSLLEFLNENSIDNCSILALLPGNCNSGRDFNYDRYRSAYLDFLISLYLEREKSVSHVGIREIDTCLDILNGKNPRHCELLGNCIGTYFSVEPDGKISHCDKYVGDSSYTVGNLLFASLQEIKQSSDFHQLKTHTDQRTKVYERCKYFEKCRGWCPHEAYLKDLYGSKETGCCGLSTLLDQLSQIQIQKLELQNE